MRFCHAAPVCASLVVLAEPGKAQSMGRNAREVVETRFSEAIMVDRYERLFLALSGERLRPAAELAH